MRKPAALLALTGPRCLRSPFLAPVGFAGKGPSDEGNQSVAGVAAASPAVEAVDGRRRPSASRQPLVYDANGNGLPNVGDVVTFNISTTATDQPFVNLLCYQSGVLVAEGWEGYFEGALNNPSRNFTLASGKREGFPGSRLHSVAGHAYEAGLEAPRPDELPRVRVTERPSLSRGQEGRGPGFRRGLWLSDRQAPVLAAISR